MQETWHFAQEALYIYMKMVSKTQGCEAEMEGCSLGKWNVPEHRYAYGVIEFLQEQREVRLWTKYQMMASEGMCCDAGASSASQDTAASYHLEYSHRGVLNILVSIVQMKSMSLL